MAASDALRRLALDEDLKAKAAGDPELTAVVWRIARRYVAGPVLPDALARARRLLK